MAKTTSHLGIETKTEFAKRLGVNKSTITRWDKAGRLVLAQNGKVIVQESLAQISATQGHRTDLTEKHALDRGQAITKPTESAKNATDNDMDATEQQVGKDRAYYKAIALDIGNKQLRLDEALSRGIRINKEDYQKKISLLASQVKSGVERLIDNLAPQLANISNSAERSNKLNQEINNLMENLK